MWQVIAEENMHCNECHHRISADAICLSQLPTQLTNGLRRRRYAKFCIGCAVCQSKGKADQCYVRFLDHWYTPKGETPEGILCGHCGSVLPTGTRSYVQKYFAWPYFRQAHENEKDTGNSDNSNGSGVAGAAGTAGARSARQAASAAWESLSSDLKGLFRTRGVGGSRGLRSDAMAKRLYRSIPEGIRNQGEAAIRKFLKEHHASHIKSVKNAPQWAKRPSNVVWERIKQNLARGSRNMTGAEVSAAKTTVRTAAIKATFRGVAKGGIFAALVEAPIAGVENALHWKRGRKSAKQAAKDAARSTTGAGVVGVGATAAFAVVAKGATMAGVGLSLLPLGTPLMVAGGGVIVGSTIHRIYKAAKQDLPLEELRVFFCENRGCRRQYARGLSETSRSLVPTSPRPTH